MFCGFNHKRATKLNLNTWKLQLSSSLRIEFANSLFFLKKTDTGQQVMHYCA